MTRGRHGCDAVLENGPAAPELRHRCASLHHGRGPHGPAEYKGVARVRVRHGELPSDREIRLDRTKPHTSLTQKCFVLRWIASFTDTELTAVRREMWTEEHSRIYRRESGGFPSDLRDAEWAQFAGIGNVSFQNTATTVSRVPVLGCPGPVS